jgi:hypothetical protein
VARLRAHLRPYLRLRPVWPAGWWLDVGLLAAFVLLTFALVARTPLLGLDTAVAHWCDAHRPTALYWLARVFNFLGQGGWLLLPLALVTAAWVAHRTRSLRPLLPIAGAMALLYLTIGPLKLWTDRAAPHATIDHPEYMFHSLSGQSYPSGHLANTIVWYGVIATLLAPYLEARWRLALRVVPPVAVFATTTYLGYHWVSDDVAGVLLGVVPRWRR